MKKKSRREMREFVVQRLATAAGALQEAAEWLPVAVDGNAPLTLSSQLQAAIWTVEDIKRRIDQYDR